MELWGNNRDIEILEKVENGFNSFSPAAKAAWRIFGELNSQRPIGMGGAGAIPIPIIETYFRMLGEELDWRLINLIRAIDAAYMDHQAKTAKQK